MNRVWMITGAGRGLGHAFAEEAVKNGDKVIATIRKINDTDPLMKNENVLPVIMDVTKKEEVAAAVDAGIRKFGRIDVLINNAGFGMSGAFEEVSDEELRTLMETNFFGVTNVTRAVLPTMRKQGGGMILTVSSQAGAMGFLGSSAYCSSKYAVVGLKLRLLLFQVCGGGSFGSAQHGTGSIWNPGRFHPARFLPDGFQRQQLHETCKNFAGSL